MGGDRRPASWCSRAKGRLPGLGRPQHTCASSVESECTISGAAAGADIESKKGSTIGGIRHLFACNSLAREWMHC